MEAGCAQIRARGRHGARGARRSDEVATSIDSKPDQLDALITSASLQLRCELDKKAEQATKKRASAAATPATPAPSRTREQCAAEFAVMVKEIHTTRASVRAAVTKWNVLHDGPAKTSREQVRKCLKLLDVEDKHSFSRLFNRL